MRFAYVVGAFLLSGTAVFLACSDDPPGTGAGTSTSSSSSSTSSSGGSSGQQPNGDDDEAEVDSGIKRAPKNPDGSSGCILHSTDYQKAGKVESLPREGVSSGGVAWATPEGAQSEDGNFATVTLEDGQESATLALSDYKFEIPNDKATYGITVQLKRQSMDAGIRDSAIEVTLDTKQVPTSKFVASDWPRLIVGTHHYGQEVDTWGTDLNPPNINRVQFGARISAKRNPGVTGPVLGRVDSVKIRISYCNADGT